MSMTNRCSFGLQYRSPETVDGHTQETAWGHHLMTGGRITVVERLTGFGWWDVETGYRSPCGQFWLASGQHDIRRALPDLDSEDAMAEWVMARANNCRGGHYGKVGVSPEWLDRWNNNKEPRRVY